MAAKAKAKPAAKTKSSRKATSRKKAESQFPQAFISNARFAPGTEVGFWKVTDVGSERAEGRAPFPKAMKTATVGKDGSLAVNGLEPGSYLAAAENGDGGQWTYLQFSVKAEG
jgi:hypothetical protein